MHVAPEHWYEGDVLPGRRVLPPNLNAELGLPSVHSYNSLSSRRYHELVKSLGGEMLVYGRWNGMLSPDYSSPMFWMSNIGLILSPRKIEHDNLEYLGMESGVYLYRVISRMGDSRQVILPQSDIEARNATVVDPRQLPGVTPVKTVDRGDLLEFDVSRGVSSLLILSQKFHRDWNASLLIDQKWHSTYTVEINGVFEGVFLPSNAQRVRFEFKPLTRYAWVAHVFWFLLLVVPGLRIWQKRRWGALERV